MGVLSIHSEICCLGQLPDESNAPLSVFLVGGTRYYYGLYLS